MLGVDRSKQFKLEAELKTLHVLYNQEFGRSISRRNWNRIVNWLDLRNGEIDALTRRELVVGLAEIRRKKARLQCDRSRVEQYLVLSEIQSSESLTGMEIYECISSVYPIGFRQMQRWFSQSGRLSLSAKARYSGEDLRAAFEIAMFRLWGSNAKSVEIFEQQGLLVNG